MAFRDVVLALGATVYARLGEVSGTAAADEVGGAAGAYRGGVTLGQPGLLPTDSNTAAVFDGRTGFVTFADRVELDFGDTFTIVAHILPTETDLRCIVDNGSGSAILRTQVDARLLLRRNSVQDVAVSRVALTLGVRQMIAATKRASTVRLYRNRGEDITGTVTNSTMANNALPFTIGAADAGTVNFFEGAIDEVAVFAGVELTQGQVQAIYDAGRTYEIGQASETDEAQPVGRAKSRVLGQALELDQALAVGGIKIREIGQALEFDRALALHRVAGLRLPTRLTIDPVDEHRLQLDDVALRELLLDPAFQTLAIDDIHHGLALDAAD